MSNLSVVLRVVCLSILLLAGCGGGGGSAPVQPWAKSYGGADMDLAQSIQQTSDGGYIVAGYTKSFDAGDQNIWVLKLKSDGEISWQKRYGGAGADEAYSIQQTRDGGYIVAGHTWCFGAGNADFWVLKLESDGEVSWQNAYGGTENDYYVNSVRQTNDGGYIVAGYTESFGAVLADFWVLKLKSDGTIDWEKRYGGLDNDYARSIQQTRDGGYIVAGQTYSFGTGGDFWVLKLNSAGDISWQKTYGGAGYDCANSIQQTSDGGYIVAGPTNSSGAGANDFWVLKLNSSGAVLWQKTYGAIFVDIPYSIYQTSGGGYIVAGCTMSFGDFSNSDFWVLKLKSDGTVSWQKRYGGANDDSANSIQQTSDGGYIVAGSTDSFGAGDYDLWVLKLKSDGTIEFDPLSGAHMEDTTADVTVTPTSVSGVDTIVTGVLTSATVTLTDIDAVVTDATIVQQAP
jgi:uncharacterized delta-60 repeat protein